MSNDRYKFRVWDNLHQDYLPEGVLIDGRTGKVAGTNTEHYTIEQCTGLKDINGKLIYEGDVVMYGWIIPRVVTYQDGCFMFDRAEPLCECLCLSREIIGNIHERKENTL